MYKITAHTGEEILIPSSASEDKPYFASMDKEAIEYYYLHGYVVLRNLLPREFTSAARMAFASEIKAYNGYIYRQTTSRPERNVFNALGQVMNPVLNVQSVSSLKFPNFRKASLACIANEKIKSALESLYQDKLKIVQSMYFEGNTATAPHQDTFYLDSEHLGEMCAAWIALEDIAPNAGRFFVCPGSHRVDMSEVCGDFHVAGDSLRYQAIVLEMLKKSKLEIVAPALSEGDVLLWNARTIHGSLASPDATTSRQSLTAHYIPDKSRFMQLQARIKPLTYTEVGGVKVAMIKSQDKVLNRMILWAETNLSFIFNPLKTAAVRIMTRRV